MIRLIEKAFPQGFDARQTVCGVRICTLRDAWKGLPAYCGAPDFYTTGGDSVLSVLDGVCTLDGDTFDSEELLEFLRMRGCKTLVCSGTAAQRLGDCKAVRRNPVLSCNGAGVTTDARVDWDPPLPSVYLLISEVFDNMDGVQFHAWYSDISLKKRRGIARIVGIRENGELQATAGIYHQNAGAVVLGSVATYEQARGRGFAGKLVNALAASAAKEGKRTFIVAKNERVAALYERLGFARTAELCEIYLNNGAAEAVCTDEERKEAKA